MRLKESAQNCLLDQVTRPKTTIHQEDNYLPGYQQMENSDLGLQFAETYLFQYLKFERKSYLSDSGHTLLLICTACIAEETREPLDIENITNTELSSGKILVSRDRK